MILPKTICIRMQRPEDSIDYSLDGKYSAMIPIASPAMIITAVRPLFVS
jgi:hypothetical protein